MSYAFTMNAGAPYAFAPSPDLVEGTLHQIYIVFEGSDGVRRACLRCGTVRSDRGHDIATRPSGQCRNIGRARCPAWSTSPLRQGCNRAKHGMQLPRKPTGLRQRT